MLNSDLHTSWGKKVGTHCLPVQCGALKPVRYCGEDLFFSFVLQSNPGFFFYGLDRMSFHPLYLDLLKKLVEFPVLAERLEKS